MRRIPELDSLRGLAAIAVVLFHLRFGSWTFLGTSVDLFFVLSGYLITRIILEESTRPGFFRVFYARRVLRIFPVYYVGLALVVVTNPWRHAPEPLEGLWRYATYTQFVEGYWSEPVMRFSRWFLHSWTLALEEQFYLVWPLLVVLIGRKGVLRAALPLVALSTYLRARGVFQHLLLSRTDGLMMGAVLAALFVDEAWTGRHASTLRRVCLAVCLAGGAVRGVLVLSMPAVLRHGVGTHWPLTVSALIVTWQCLAYAGLIGLVVLSTGAGWLAPLRRPGLRYLGTISYGIYVYHPVVMGAALTFHTRVLGWKNNARLDALKFVLALGFAALSWHVLEKPVLRLKDRFRYRTAPPEPHFGRAVREAPASVAGPDGPSV